MDRKIRVRRRLARRAAAACALACTPALSGCGLLGAAGTISSPTVLTVSSGAFGRGGMPARYTCANPRAVNPPVEWTGTPPGTKSIALVVDDKEAPITPYVYWIVFDIGPGTSAIMEGQLPPGARQARGSAGYDHYDPPCPGPQGHGYRFTVYALNSVLDLPSGASLQSAWRAIAAAAIGRGRITVNSAS